MAKYLILGKNGQLGKEFVKILDNKKNDFVALGHEECDISDLNRVLEIFENVKPDIVINCAAYNQV
ncbi:sugar nucleotide-binding protein, partial [Persephonella sp.]